MDTYKFQVEDEWEGIRIDKFLSGNLDFLSRSYLQKMIQEQRVTVNGKTVKANYMLRPDEEVEFHLPESVEPEILPQEIPLEVLYEDEDVIVVNKPKGMVVHPAPGHYSGTLVNALLAHCKDSLSGINGVMRPGIVHRIDKDTTGSLIACKNDLAHESIAAQLKEHSILRRYRAICMGVLKEEEYRIDAPIGRHPAERKRMAVNQRNGKPAVTRVRVLERLKNATYIECQLETGRTHQIRVHLSSLGHPLLGDEVYGDSKNRFKLQGQTLHAFILGFHHPKDGHYVETVAPLPEYFMALLTRLRENHGE
ncbi:MAG: RluA family pseudouridine synthase [Lachnospiraceae bacterium]|nr:RluA family pseudouridine synthase [Lachnospiraceae bacterium]MDD7027122.1 RluA family pseudouridine synthase [Lachnospiraceae bacterium]MDY5700167.1 RluA family pseudouridine synthase [Lachnospiraceae bacterium]